MTTDGRTARHFTPTSPSSTRPSCTSPSSTRRRVSARGAGLGVTALLAMTLLAGCSSSKKSDSAAGAVGSAAGATAAASSAASTAVPTADVVSAVEADATIKAELPASLVSGGKVALGTTLAPGTAGLPHVGQIDGKDVGVDVDLRNAVAKVLGISWDVQNGTFATIIPGVQNGKYAIGQDNFGVTKAREEVVDFATYLTDGQSFLGAKSVNLDKVSSITDVCGLNIATSPGSTFQQILTAAAGKCAAAGKKDFAVQYFADTAPIFLGLANGKVDAYFGPTLSLQYDATHIADTKYLGQISSTVVGFVTAKGSPLAKAVSDAVNKLITDGTYKKILDKWGVLTSSGIDKSEVNPTPSL